MGTSRWHTKFRQLKTNIAWTHAEQYESGAWSKALLHGGVISRRCWGLHELTKIDLYTCDFFFFEALSWKTCFHLITSLHPFHPKSLALSDLTHLRVIYQSWDSQAFYTHKTSNLWANFVPFCAPFISVQYIFWVYIGYVYLCGVTIKQYT